MSCRDENLNRGECQSPQAAVTLKQGQRNTYSGMFGEVTSFSASPCLPVIKQIEPATCLTETLQTEILSGP